MKRFTVLFLAALVSLPLFGAADIFLKFDTIPGDATQPGHAGWFELSSFGWGASQPGAQACATTHTLSFTRKGPVSERLTLLCKQHAQMPSMTLDIGGQRHLLQNVAFTQCTSEPAGGGNAFESYTLNFGRCATHANAAMNNAAVKIDRAIDVKMNAPNAILIGLSPRPEAVSMVALNFMGANAAKLVRKPAANNAPSALDELARTHQKLPTFSITLNNGQKWTFTDVMVSSYTGTTRPGTASFSLNFSNVQGPLTGFQDLSYKE